MYIKLSDKHKLWHRTNNSKWTACGQQIDWEKCIGPALDADVPTLKICNWCQADKEKPK